MKIDSRADRVMIFIALAIFLMAGGLFYFDNWIWGSRHDRGDRIGNLTFKSGDVRMKFEGELKFQKAAQGQELVYNDSVYAGGGGQAKLQLGDSEMTVNENTLVVLRRQNNVNFMNLAYGNLFGKVAKNEKILIETGSGKPIELLTSSKASFKIKKSGDRTELEVTSGDAEITVDGKKTRVDSSSRLVVDSKRGGQVEKILLTVVRPLHDQVVYAEEPSAIDFAWKWSSGRRPAALEKYAVEFSTSPNFTKLDAKREVVGQLNTVLPVDQSTSLFFRVRGPAGELSSPEKINFVRTHKPLVIRPVPNAKFVVGRGELAPVEVEFRRAPQASVWYQISGDQEFKSALKRNENIHDLKKLAQLPPGKYFLRARADYGSGHTTSWTDALPFEVEQRVETLPLVELPAVSRVVIPNRGYPAPLYQSASARVKDFLSRGGFLREYFPVAPGDFERLNVQIDSSPAMSQTTTSWPKEKLRPGRYIYKYQVAKQGYNPSAWSGSKKLEITMEPPKPVGEPQYGTPDKSGATETRAAFTPLLFAKTYDVEYGRDPALRRPAEVNVPQASFSAKVDGDMYWRARARDAQGRIISDFSPIYKAKRQAPVYLAKTEAQRAPAAVEKTTARIERQEDETFSKNGWWAWIGGGENYVDYRQSIPGRGTLTDQHLKGPSEYVETGFVGTNGIGAIVSFKHTPGEVNPDNAPIDSTSYSWNSLALEGLVRKTSPLTLFGSPIIYGLRAGVQQHRLPFVVLDADANLLLKANVSTNASLGALAELSRNRWTYYWTMRYQYPLSSKADGSSQFDVSPVFSFDGSVGTSYNLTKQLKLGMFWYGQWQQFNFTYGDGQVVNKGFQSLFYSNVDFRLGFDF